ncbi:MAG: hypothetical protein ACK4OM_07070 [Alphaproteobacteria bacterium]
MTENSQIFLNQIFNAPGGAIQNNPLPVTETNASNNLVKRNEFDLSGDSNSWTKYISEKKSKRKALFRSDSVIEREINSKDTDCFNMNKKRKFEKTSRQRLLSSAPEISDLSIKTKLENTYVIEKNKLDHITIPVIDYENSDKVVGYRPSSKDGKFKVDYRIEDNVLIVDFLYFSGSGYTSAQGLIKEFIEGKFLELLRKKPELKGCLKNGIAVIGKGTIGCTASILVDEILKNNPEFSKDYQNKGIEIFANQIDDLASHYAGGLVSVTAIKDSEESRDAAIKTLEFWDKIKRGEDDVFHFSSEVVNEIVAYFEEDTDQGMQYYVEAGKIDPPEIVDVEINGVIHKNVKKYSKARFLDIDAIMKGYNQEIIRRGIKAPTTSDELRTINDFEELKKQNIRVILNCSGMGRFDPSKKLQDNENCFNKESVGIIGHLIYGYSQNAFVNSEGEKYVYIAQPTISNTKTGQEYKPRLQIMPKIIRDKDGNTIYNFAIGGTFLKTHEIDIEKDYHRQKFDEHAYYFGSQEKRNSENFRNWKVRVPNRTTDKYVNQLSPSVKKDSNKEEIISM